MFDYTSLHWLTFLSAAVLLNLSPGPDMAFILGQAASNGRRAGFAAMAGIWSGTFLHVILAAIGHWAFRYFGGVRRGLCSCEMGGSGVSGLAGFARALFTRQPAHPTRRCDGHTTPETTRLGHLPARRAGVCVESQSSHLFPGFFAPIRRSRCGAGWGADVFTRQPHHRRCRPD